MSINRIIVERMLFKFNLYRYRFEIYKCLLATMGFFILMSAAFYFNNLKLARSTLFIVPFLYVACSLWYYRRLGKNENKCKTCGYMALTGCLQMRIVAYNHMQKSIGYCARHHIVVNRMEKPKCFVHHEVHNEREQARQYLLNEYHAESSERQFVHRILNKAW